MAGTITPVGYGRSSVLIWYRLISIYSLAQIVAAMLTGLVFAGSGALLRTLYPWHASPAVVAIAAILVAIGALHDAKLLPFRLPSRCWQVPQSWKGFSPAMMAACYGFGIGLGVLTRIPFANFYLVLAACAALANIPLGIGLMALYGASRAGAVAIVARGQAFASDPSQRLLSFSRLTPLIGYIDGILLASLGGLLLSRLVPTQS